MKKIAISIIFTMIPVIVFAQSTTTSDLTNLIQQLQQQQSALELGSIEDLFDKNTGLPIGVEEKISVKLDDLYPQPNQTITATAVSNATNLDKAQISWSLNDKIIEKGIGLTKFTFKTGVLGKDQKLTVYIEKIEGGVFTDSYRISTSEVDMYYEAQTFVPPFYNGKAKFSNQSSVIVYATPRGMGADGKLIPVENYTYKWYVNDRAFQSLSGYGKNYFVYTDSILSEPAKISVTVSSRDGSVAGEGVIVLRPSSPKISFYEENPIYGTIYESSMLGTRNLDREEITFRAIPYFFDNNIFGLNFIWKMNGITIEGLGNSNIITFRQQEGVTGESNISAEVKNNDKIFQNTKNSFSLMFSEEKQRQFSF